MGFYGLEEHEKLTNLHEYNHALFQNMMLFLDIVWEINIRTGTVVPLEDRTVLGKNGIEFVYQQFYEDCLKNRVKPEDQETFRRYMAPEHLQTITEEEQFTVRLHTAEGWWAAHQIALTPTCDETGALDCVYLCAQNIQEKVMSQRSQEQFKDSLLANSYFYFTYDVSGDGMIHHDYTTSFGARPIQEATGMELPIPYDLWAEKWYELYDPVFEKEQEVNVFSVKYMREAFARGERTFDVEVKQTPPWSNGQSEIVQISVLLLEGPSAGDITAWIIWRNVNSFRQSAIQSNLDLQIANQHLKRTVSQEEQFRQATLSGAMMVYNINLSRDMIEDEFYEIVDGRRYPMLEMVGLTAPCNFDEFCRRWSEAKVPGESRDSFLQLYNRRYLLDAYERGERVLEIEFDTRIGRGIPVTLRNTVLLMKDDATGDIIANVSGKDVSAMRREEREQREALRSAYEAANAANAAKSDFLARMSHDIRTPMNAVIGMTAIARANLDDRARVEDCLGKIDVSSRHLLSLINEVLDMSAIEAGRISLQDAAFSLFDFVEAVRELSEPQAEVRGHAFSVSVGNIEHELVIGDSQRLQQAVMNLVSNAIKYTPNGGVVEMSLAEKPTNRPQIGCYELTVRDNGVGMSRDFLQHIFEPFARSSEEMSRRQQGTGLGLSITKSIIEMMNGTIRVDSTPGVGTTFTVTFFLRLQPRDQDLGGNLFAGLSVLVADDDEAACEAACAVLSDMGMKSERVLSGRGAVERVVARHRAGDDFYAVILDWKMPDLDGVETAREIRRLVGDDLIIILCSFDCSAVEAEARAAGVNAFLSKPVFRSRLAYIFNTISGRNLEMEKQAPLQALEGRDYSGSKVLLAEDNDLNAEIAMEILGMTGLKVDRVENGKAAFDRMMSVEDGYYDMIFMDIQMPVMNGHEAVRAIRALGREYTNSVPIVALSANALAEDVEASRASGMNGHLAKPIDFEQLEKVLEQWITR